MGHRGDEPAVDVLADVDPDHDVHPIFPAEVGFFDGSILVAGDDHLGCSDCSEKMKLYVQIIYFAAVNSIVTLFFTLIREPEIALGFSVNALGLTCLGAIARGKGWV